MARALYLNDPCPHCGSPVLETVIQPSAVNPAVSYVVIRHVEKTFTPRDTNCYEVIENVRRMPDV